MKKERSKKTTIARLFGMIFQKADHKEERQFSRLGKLGGRLVVMRATGTLL